jgi:hypothetical protein
MFYSTGPDATFKKRMARTDNKIGSYNLSEYFIIFLTFSAKFYKTFYGRNLSIIL